MPGDVHYIFKSNLREVNDEAATINIPYHPHRKNLHLSDNQTKFLRCFHTVHRYLPIPLNSV